MKTRHSVRWLMTGWLQNYGHANVAVFDFYNVLTSNGGDYTVNDLNAAGGNHHRWQNGSMQWIQGSDNNTSAYTNGDSHPSSAGGQKASGEFAQVLNVYYHRWKDSISPVNGPYHIHMPVVLQQY